jgi:NAD(P)-dependent dehydrogenase (short-subunit alcohol dehydrogenase family)
MIGGGGGSIVNLSSGTAYLDPPAPTGRGGWGVAYAAAKAALTRIVPILHVEHAGDGIRAFNVDPGFVVNERMRATSASGQFTDAGFRGVPPEVPGAAVAWLATDPAAEAYAGTLVQAQKLCRDLGLVPGWPPPTTP